MEFQEQCSLVFNKDLMKTCEGIGLGSFRSHSHGFLFNKDLKKNVRELVWGVTGAIPIGF